MGSGKEPSFLKLMGWDAWEVGGLKLKKKKKKKLQFLSAKITWHTAPPKQADWETSCPVHRIKLPRYFPIAYLNGLFTSRSVYIKS